MRLEENIPAIIEDLYAGTLDDLAWNRALIGIADLASGSDALLFGLNPTNGEILRDEWRRFDPTALKQYRESWIAKDLRIPLAMQKPTNKPIVELALLTNRQWKSSEIYNDFLLRIDSPWFLVFWLHKGPERIVAVSINGTRHRGPFEASDGERITPLIPHLRRALEIKDKLETAQVRSGTYMRCLDHPGYGVAVLDGAGRILETNSRAQALLRNGEGIGRNPDGTLLLREPAGAEFREWLFTGTPPASNTDGLLHVSRLVGRPLSILVTRLPQVTTSWISGGPPCWMVLMFDPEQRLQVCKELISLDMGISEREAEIAASLGAGYALEEVAQHLTISVHTVRTHLKSCLVKTGCHTQSELVRRIVASPAWLSTPQHKW